MSVEEGPNNKGGNTIDLQCLKEEAARGLNIIHTVNRQGGSIDLEALRKGLEALANMPEAQFRSLVARQNMAGNGQNEPKSDS